MNGHISDKSDCLPDGSGYLDTHNYPSFIRSCIDIAKPMNSRKNLVSEFKDRLRSFFRKRWSGINCRNVVERQKYIFNTLWNKTIPVIKRIREIEYEQTSITEVLYGTENAVARGIEFMKNVNERMDICFDSKARSIVVEIDNDYWICVEDDY